MNPEWREKWVAALRSGEYERTAGELRRGQTNQMCCLGVLCDIVDPTDWDESGKYAGRIAFPPEEITTKVGLPECSHTYNSVNLTNRLAQMNDNGVSFFEIADFIEQNL